MIYIRTDYAGGVGDPVTQPVEFDHRHHVRDDGIDCVYCHTTVETEAYAGIPSTERCMGCHGQVWPDSPETAPLRASWENAHGAPLEARQRPPRLRLLPPRRAHPGGHRLRALPRPTSQDMARVVRVAQPDDELLPRLPPAEAGQPRDHPPHHLHDVPPMTDERLAPALAARRGDATGCAQAARGAASRRSRPGASRSRASARSCRTPWIRPEQRARRRGAVRERALARRLRRRRARRYSRGSADEARRQPRAPGGARRLAAVAAGAHPRSLRSAALARRAAPRPEPRAGRQIAAKLRALPRGPLWLVMPPQSSPTIAALLARIAAHHDLARRLSRAARSHGRVPRRARSSYGRPLEQSARSRARRRGRRARQPTSSACGPMAAAMVTRVRRARRAPRRAHEPAVGRRADADADRHDRRRAARRCPRATSPALASPSSPPRCGAAVPGCDGARGRAGAARRASARGRASSRPISTRARGAGAIIVGDRQPPVVHALARMVDHALGNPVTMTRSRRCSTRSAACALDELAPRARRRAP